MLGDALTASIADLAIGLMVVLVGLAALFLALKLIDHLETGYSGEGDEGLEDQGPEEGVWNFPPKWSPPRAESDLGDVSGKRAA